MNHGEIRLRILHILYQKYYSGEFENYQITDEIIKESELDKTNRNEVLGDIIYLKNSGLINGLDQLGTAYPLHVSITTYGMDKVENFTNDSLNQIISDSRLSDNEKHEIKEIRENTSNTTKIKKWYEFVISRPELPYIQELLRVFIGS